MKIALDKVNKEIGSELKKLGHTIVEVNSKERVDAILYNSYYEDGFLNSINDTNMTSSMHNSGVLLIDIKNKNAKEIDSILKRRLYTPLF